MRVLFAIIVALMCVSCSTIELTKLNAGPKGYVEDINRERVKFKDGTIYTFYKEIELSEIPTIYPNKEYVILYKFFPDYGIVHYEIREVEMVILHNPEIELK